MLAAEHGHTETVQALIAASADINVKHQKVSHYSCKWGMLIHTLRTIYAFNHHGITILFQKYNVIPC